MLNSSISSLAPRYPHAHYLLRSPFILQHTQRRTLYQTPPSQNSSSHVTVRKPSTRALLSQYASPAYPQVPLWSFSDLEADPQKQKLLRASLEQNAVDDLRFLRWRNALVAEDFGAALEHLSYGLRTQGSIFSSGGRFRALKVADQEALDAKIREETPAWIVEWLIANKLSSASHIPSALNILRRYPSQESCIMLAQIIVFCILHDIFPPLPQLLSILRAHEASSGRVLGVVLRALVVGGSLGRVREANSATPSRVLSTRLFIEAPNAFPRSFSEDASTRAHSTGPGPYYDAALFKPDREIHLILETMVPTSRSVTFAVLVSPRYSIHDVRTFRSTSLPRRLDAATMLALLHAKPPLPPSTIRLVLQLSRVDSGLPALPAGGTERSLPSAGTNSALLPSVLPLSPSASNGLVHWDEDLESDLDLEDAPQLQITPEDELRGLSRALASRGSSTALLSLTRRARMRSPRKPKEDTGSIMTTGNDDSPISREGVSFPTATRIGLDFLFSLAKNRKAHDKKYYPRHVITYFRNFIKTIEGDSSLRKQRSALSLRAWNKFTMVMARQDGLPARELLKLVKTVSEMRVSAPSPSSSSPEPKMPNEEMPSEPSAERTEPSTSGTPTLPTSPSQVLPPPSGLYTSTLTACVLGLIRRGKIDTAYELWSGFLLPRVKLQPEPDWAAISAGGRVLADSGRLGEAFELVMESVDRWDVSWESELIRKRREMKAFSRELRGRRGFEVEGESGGTVSSGLNSSRSMILIFASFFASYMRTLAHRRRPDVVYALWDAVAVPSTSTTLPSFPIRPTNLMLNTALMTASSFSTEDCAIHLSQQFGWRLKRSSNSAESSSLADIRVLLDDTTKPTQKDVGFWWGERPAWQVAREVFREVVLGNWPHLKDVQPPAYVPTDALGGGMSVVRPLFDFSKSSSPPTKSKNSNNDTAQPSSSSAYQSLSDHPLPTSPYPYPSIILDHRSFDAYIRLLCTHGLEAELPLTLAWMRELGIRPSQRSIRLALVRFETVGMSAPFDEVVLEPLFSSSSVDKGSKERINRWASRRGLEDTISVENGNSPYAHLWRWVREWVGPRTFPSGGALLAEKKLWEMKLAKIRSPSSAVPPPTSPQKQKPRARHGKAGRPEQDEYDQARHEIQRAIRARQSFLTLGKHRRRTLVRIEREDGSLEKKWVKRDLRKRTVGARWEAGQRERIAGMLRARREAGQGGGDQDRVRVEVW